MSTIRAKQFKGYASKSDLHWEDLSILSNAEGVIINKGDIVNFPQAKSVAHVTPMARNYLPFLYTRSGELFICTISWDGGIEFFDSEGISVTNANVPSSTVQSKFDNFIDVTKGKTADGNSNLMRANGVQVGEWLYIYTDLGLDDPVTPTHETESDRETSRSYGRMFRVKLNASNHVEILLVGLPPIINVARAADQSNVAANDRWFTGDYDKASFAFSLVTNTTKKFEPWGEVEGATISSFEHGFHRDKDDLESVVIVDTVLDRQIATGEHPRFTINLPHEYAVQESYFNAQDHNEEFMGVAVYIKTPNESVYRFYSFHPPWVNSGASTWTLNGHLWSFTVDLDTTHVIANKVHSTLTAPLTDHFPVYPGYHALFYKGNMYTAAFDREYGQDEINSEIFIKKIAGNYLQVSKGFNDEFVEHPFSIPYPEKAQINAYKVPNYVDGTLSSFIGDVSQPITGLIEYFGQQYIFKENSTWVLTDDIEVGTLREQWHNIGCVGANGGRAYAVGNNRLFWASHDAVWMYDGSEPVKISERIEEALREVDPVRYQSLRMGYDDNLELLLLCFPSVPGEELSPLNERLIIPPFVCSINDSFAWTKGPPDRQLNDVLSQGGQVYYFYEDAIEKMGNIESLRGSGQGPFHEWLIQTALVTRGDPSKEKHWKDFYLQGVTSLPQVSDPVENQSVGNFFAITIIDDSTGDVVASFQETYEKLNNRVHLGLFARGLRITIKGLYESHFRISGFKLSVNERGRK